MTGHDGVYTGSSGYESEVGDLRRQLAVATAKAKALDLLETMAKAAAGIELYVTDSDEVQMFLLRRDGSFNNTFEEVRAATLPAAIAALAARLQEAGEHE